MKLKFSINDFITYCWIGLVGLFIYMWASQLEFANEISYGFALVLLGIIPIYYSFFQKRKSNATEKIFSIVFTISIIVLFLFSNITSWGGTYKTQTVTHRSKINPKYRVEFQMMDMGALGYRKRTVEVRDLTFIFKWITPINKENIDLNKWKEVNEDVNELNLKGG